MNRLFKIIKYVTTKETYYVENRDIDAAKASMKEPNHSEIIREDVVSVYETYESERLHQMNQWKRDTI